MADCDLDSLLFSTELSDLNHALRLVILKKIGGIEKMALDHKMEDYDGYFKYFSSECQTWSAMANDIALQTYRDLINLMEHLRNNKSQARTSVQILGFFPPEPQAGSISSFTPIPTEAQKSLPLRNRYVSCDKIQKQNAITMTVKLWLMVNCGPQQPYERAGTSLIHWAENESLSDVVTKGFKTEEPVQPEKSFPKNINSHSLERVAGFRIVWTEHLADHLALNDEVTNPTVKLFRFPSILQVHRSEDESGMSQEGQVLPDELLEETLHSLALLLPCWDERCKKWFEKAAKHTKIPLDPKAREQTLGNRGRNPARYKYWGERLCLIKQAYDESEPTTISQWWNDRRNGTRWYSFWGAIVLVVCLTIIFGLISSVTGIMQVYIAYSPSSAPTPSS